MSPLKDLAMPPHANLCIFLGFLAPMALSSLECLGQDHRALSPRIHSFPLHKGKSAQSPSVDWKGGIAACQFGGAGAEHAVIIFRMHPASGTLERVKRIPNAESPVCLPHRGEVALFVAGEKAWHIYGYAGDHKGRVEGSSLGPYSRISVAPDSQHVAFHSLHQDGSDELRIYGIDVAERRLVTGPKGFQPTFCGRRVYFFVQQGDGAEASFPETTQLVGADQDFRNAAPVALFRGMMVMPSCSRDGSRIAMIKIEPGGTKAVLIYDSKTKELTRVTEESEGNFVEPLFAPGRPGLLAYRKESAPPPFGFNPRESGADRLTRILVRSLEGERQNFTAAAKAFGGTYTWDLSEPVLAWLSTDAGGDSSESLKIAVFDSD